MWSTVYSIILHLAQNPFIHSDLRSPAPWTTTIRRSPREWDPLGLLSLSFTNELCICCMLPSSLAEVFIFYDRMFIHRSPSVTCHHPLRPESSANRTQRKHFNHDAVYVIIKKRGSTRDIIRVTNLITIFHFIGATGYYCFALACSVGFRLAETYCFGWEWMGTNAGL